MAVRRRAPRAQRPRSRNGVRVIEATASHRNLRRTLVDGTIRDTFREDLLETLAQPVGAKAISPKHLYDARGSELFDQICDADEYYIPRVESSIVRDRIDEISAALGPDLVLAEPGSGSAQKVEPILEALDSPAAFAPVEISASPLRESSARIAERFPDLAVHPVCAEFHTGLNMLTDLPDERRAIFFPGSTIGNMPADERAALLRSFAGFVGPSGRVLIGFDLVKDRDVLRAAYDDREGISAAFALNVLHRITRELGEGLDASAFRYDARWNEDESRIEMAIASTRDHEGEVAGVPFRFAQGERMRTEISHKFTLDSIRAEAANAGMRVVEHWTDERGWFALCLLEAADE
jgi:dimethylhistidine N-methyltransferase